MNGDNRRTFWILLVHAGVSVIVIAATSVLTALGDLPASATTAIFGAAIGLVGGIQIGRGQEAPPAVPAAPPSPSGIA